MKTALWTAFLFSAVISCRGQQKETESLSVEAFEKGIQQADIQLLDVRTSEEYRSGHIRKALQANWNNPAEFRERTVALDKNKPVYVYCASGVRSAAASEWLRKNGYKKVYNLEGGVIRWKSQGKPLEGASGAKQMTREEYLAKISTGKVVLVDFGAEWCPPCKKMEPVVSELRRELEGKFQFVQVDAGTHTQVMQQLGVEKLPTFIVYRDGKEVWRRQGIVDGSELKEHLIQ